MTTKIDVTSILKEHVDSLRDAGTKNISRLDVAVMFGIPLALGVLALVVGFHVKDDHIGTLVSAFSIFAGFLFNVIVLIYGFDPPSKTDVTADDQMILLSQTFANISYAVIVSIAVVLVLLFMLFIGSGVQVLVSSIFVVLATNFGLSLLMVLKRIYVLLGLKFRGE
ncbi:MAG: hypothetical protein E5V25_04285 [Mesorhizobium sp.]|uniref:hypothetical protein n=1 Tax=Mesorhizobium sp. TaxID=1871066 RepID=UPI000FE5FF96|nr:hypothetical protein [Mesorhizobium sp.]RWD80467.1 MAG: hypothetical protein EOS48_17955 [Mesorhizobium sp.]TIS37421.1 MAG: hypothetical protein E5W95_17525 [Mesorhizobium sp.]TIX73903.1 MAG: hypothetical protein E5V25_04285 [Mesorhizobium sp.]